MTGVEWILLLIGSVFMIGSFFVTEKLSPSELNQIAELSESELKRIIEKALASAETKIEEAIDSQIDASSEKVDRALEKETNDKIMAISEFSDTVIENMNKTHNEIMFLYSMLNDKHTELTGMTSNLQRLAADVRSLEENMQIATQPQAPQTPVPQAPQTSAPQAAQMTQAAALQSAQGKTAPTKAEEAPMTKKEEGASQKPDETEKPTKDGLHAEIRKLKKQGLTEVQIAKKLGIGIGEVRLVNGLYRGEKDS